MYGVFRRISCSPSTRLLGAQVLNFLLPEMENLRGKLVVVLAGYQKPMEDLLAFNDGFRSRFPFTFDFPDYNAKEMHAMLKNLLKDPKNKFHVSEDRILRIASRRLEAMAGQTGFGNAREVRNLLERTMRRQAEIASTDCGENGMRLSKEQMFELQRDDFLGPRELKESAALKRLEGLMGLSSIKQQVRNLLEATKTNAELEEREEPTRPVNLNRLFLGNPGKALQGMVRHCREWALYGGDNCWLYPYKLHICRRLIAHITASL